MNQAMYIVFNVKDITRLLSFDEQRAFNNLLCKIIAEKSKRGEFSDKPRLVVVDVEKGYDVGVEFDKQVDEIVEIVKSCFEKQGLLGGQKENGEGESQRSDSEV